MNMLKITLLRVIFAWSHAQNDILRLMHSPAITARRQRAFRRLANIEPIPISFDVRESATQTPPPRTTAVFNTTPGYSIPLIVRVPQPEAELAAQQTSHMLVRQRLVDAYVLEELLFEALRKEPLIINDEVIRLGLALLWHDEPFDEVVVILVDLYGYTA